MWGEGSQFRGLAIVGVSELLLTPSQRHVVPVRARPGESKQPTGLLTLEFLGKDWGGPWRDCEVMPGVHRTFEAGEAARPGLSTGEGEPGEAGALTTSTGMPSSSFAQAASTASSSLLWDLVSTKKLLLVVLQPISNRSSLLGGNSLLWECNDLILQESYRSWQGGARWRCAVWKSCSPSLQPVQTEQQPEVGAGLECEHNMAADFLGSLKR